MSSTVGCADKGKSRARDRDKDPSLAIGGRLSFISLDSAQRSIIPFVLSCYNDSASTELAPELFDRLDRVMVVCIDR